MNIKNKLFPVLAVGLALNLAGCAYLSLVTQMLGGEQPAKVAEIKQETVDEMVRNYEKYTDLKNLFEANNITLEQRHDLFHHINTFKWDIFQVYCNGHSGDYCTEEPENPEWKPKFDFEKSTFKTKHGDITLKKEMQDLIAFQDKFLKTKFDACLKAKMVLSAEGSPAGWNPVSVDYFNEGPMHHNNSDFIPGFPVECTEVEKQTEHIPSVFGDLTSEIKDRCSGTVTFDDTNYKVTEKSRVVYEKKAKGWCWSAKVRNRTWYTDANPIPKFNYTQGYYGTMRNECEHWACKMAQE